MPTLAVVTVQTTSPLCAAIKVSKEATTALVKPSLAENMVKIHVNSGRDQNLQHPGTHLLFSAKASSRFLLSSFTFRVLHTPPMPSSLMLLKIFAFRIVISVNEPTS